MTVILWMWIKNVLFDQCFIFIVMQQAIIEPHYAPNVQYITKFWIYQTIILDDESQYEKQSYRNRTYVAGANKVLLLNIPLKQGKTKLPLKDVRIDNTTHWQRKHWAAITSAYGKTPYFFYYEAPLKAIYQANHTFLVEFTYNLLALILKWLRVPASYHLASEVNNRELLNGEDWLSVIHPKKPLNDAQFKSVAYTQAFEEKFGFRSNLSILDLLFNEGPASGQILKQCIVDQG